MSWIECASTVAFKPFSLEEALGGVAEAGFSNVELAAIKDFAEHLPPDDASESTVRHVREVLANCGLAAVSVSGHSHVETPDGKTRLLNIVRSASQLGARAVNTFTLESTDPVTRSAFIDNVRSVADESQKLGVTICLETEGDLLPTAELGRPLIDEINHPSVKMNFDTANVVYFSDHGRPEVDVQFALPVLGHLHLKDKRGGKGVWDFPPAGEGELNLTSVLRDVEASGYEGPISVELEFGEPWADWNTCVATLRRANDFFRQWRSTETS
jgi:sugar phosphate isomerase/epimerase